MKEKLHQIYDTMIFHIEYGNAPWVALFALAVSAFAILIAKHKLYALVAQPNSLLPLSAVNLILFAFAISLLKLTYVITKEVHKRDIRCFERT